MIKIFRQSIAAQLTTILVVAGVMWAGRLVHPVPMPDPTDAAPLYKLLYTLLAPVPRLAAAGALLLHLTTGALLNNLLYDRKLIHSNMLLPMLLYVLAASLVPEGQTLTPILFINLILFWILHHLIATDTRFKLTSDQVFGVAALLSASTLFHFPALFMALPLLIILIFIYKFYNWHDITMLVLGFLAPYLLLFVYSFLTDGLLTLLTSMGDAIKQWHWTIEATDAVNLCSYVLFGLMLLSSLFFLMGYTGNKTVIYRNNATIVVLTLVGGLLMLPYCTHFTTEAQCAAIPFAFIGSLWLINSKVKPWIMNMIFTTWVLVSMAGCIL
ncbi:MAG: hypothetical protein AUK63_1685 [bacterium P3]|nr:MAG: hypothetical protein AUK63_1685 [bacterium P3]KWW39062.1 MAG: hypothetical protein F083_2022 [bacterium F083]